MGEKGTWVKRPEHTLSKEWAMGNHHLIMPTIVGRMEPHSGFRMFEMKVSAGNREAEEALWIEVERRLGAHGGEMREEMVRPGGPVGIVDKQGQNWI